MQAKRTGTRSWSPNDRRHRSRVEFGDKVAHLGGDDDFNAMQMLLAALAACDVDLVAMHASFLGIPVESLAVEATGHFNVRSYLGLEGAPGSGYDHISYTVRISAPGATPEQIAYLSERCERSSPVGDSLLHAGDPADAGVRGQRISNEYPTLPWPGGQRLYQQVGGEVAESDART